ncbi:MAG: hypothetical protein WAU45_21135 [Blastocatellia bacterium]
MRGFGTKLGIRAASAALEERGVARHRHAEGRAGGVADVLTISSATTSTVSSMPPVASGQIKLRRIDGWRKIAAVLSQHTVAA